MGTNFYARIIPTRKRKDALKELIDLSTDFRKIRDEVAATYGETNEYNWEGGEIHLGKRSGGWKFLWNPNQWKVNEGSYDTKQQKYIDNWVVKKYYDLTKESILKFLLRPDVELYDEYGEKFEDKEAWFNEIVARDSQLWADKDPMLDGEAYYKKCAAEGKPEHSFPDSREQFWRDLGYEPTGYYDFYSDGLRFSTCVDFS